MSNNLDCTSCIRDKQFDFVLDYDDEHLLYRDESVWVTPKNYNQSEKYTIEIINGGISKNFEVYVKGTTKIPYTQLPVPDTIANCNYDGIYQFRVNICDDVMHKYAAILENVKCAYSNLVITEDWETALSVLKQIEFVDAHARKRNFDLAETQYKYLVSFLKKINCSCKK